MVTQSFLRPSRPRRGFTLVELAIVLAVAALLFAGLWRLMAGGTTQTRDQAAAEQMRQLIAAVQQYLTTNANGQQWINGRTSGTPDALPLDCVAPHADLCNYLPGNASWVGVTNSYGQGYNVMVLRQDGGAVNTPATNFSFMILTVGGDTITDTSGGRISSLIGNDGGFLYTANVCGTPDEMACGSFGAWNANAVTLYGFTAAQADSGHIAARNATVSGTDTSMWLARRDYPPATEYNTMHTNMFFEAPGATTHDLFLGGNTIYGGPDAGTPLGAIQNFQFVNIVRDVPAVLNSGLRVVNGNGCVKADPLDASCNYSVMIIGDQSVTGLLYANRLYAEFFIYNTSDERLKHDIKTLEHPLEDLSKIRALSFKMNDSNEKKMGVIAQDVEKVYPELIQDIGNGYKGVDYMGLIGPLLGAVQELKAQNDQLKDQLKEHAEALTKLKTQRR